MKYTKKYIAPVIIALLLCAYYIGFAVVVARIPQIGIGLKLAGIIIPLAICGALIYVLVERIREIHSGEEDDLDNY